MPMNVEALSRLEKKHRTNFRSTLIFLGKHNGNGIGAEQESVWKFPPHLGDLYREGFFTVPNSSSTGGKLRYRFNQGAQDVIKKYLK